eukprot:EG_transcript_15870
MPPTMNAARGANTKTLLPNQSGCRPDSPCHSHPWVEGPCSWLWSSSLSSSQMDVRAFAFFRRSFRITLRSTLRFTSFVRRGGSVVQSGPAMLGPGHLAMEQSHQKIPPAKAEKTCCFGSELSG